MTWFKIALRNLLKNQRRSMYTILAIALGFAAVNVFGGFTSYIFDGLGNAYIYAQGNGHLTIFKRGYRVNGEQDPAKYMITRAEQLLIGNIVRPLPGVIVVTKQMKISGLLSNGESSTIFVAAGREPSELKLMQSLAPGKLAKIELYRGKPLRDDLPFGVGISTGLAEKLKLKLNSDAIAMAPTISGQINALDVTISQLFEASTDSLNDMLAVLPLEFAQSLYDTEGVSWMTVLMDTDHADHIDQLRDHVAGLLRAKGVDVDVFSWQEMAGFYAKVKAMFDVIFLFIFIIVLVIVVMSVVNTISMAVVERTREIGTLRALGVKRAGLVQLFAIESLLLAVFGSLLGAILTLLVWVSVRIAEPTWIPPALPRRVPLEVHLVPQYMILSLVFLLLLSLIAAVLPARRAAHMGIVDALGHN